MCSPPTSKPPDGRIVIFKVVERPVVRYVEYLGNYGLRTKKLAKETELKVGGPVDPYAVQEARRRLVDLYHRNGFNNAQVSILEGDKPTDHGIVFVINEGLAQKIWKVEFVGNEFVSTSRLKTKIDSKPPIAVHLQRLRRSRTNRRRRQQAHRLLPLVRLFRRQDRPAARIRRKEQVAHAPVRDPRRPALSGRKRRLHRQQTVLERFARLGRRAETRFQPGAAARKGLSQNPCRCRPVRGRSSRTR